MPNTIQHKRNSTPSAVPSTSQIVLGELAINVADGKVYLKTSAGTIICVGQDITTYTSKVGVIKIYTGTDSTSQGYFDDFDGKWVYLTLDSIRTIGNASSGAAIAAAWTQNLFMLWWNQYSNTVCPILDSSGSSVSRGASATADFAANRRITMPDYRGRVFSGAGSGSGLIARTKGTFFGEDNHVLTTAEMPSHPHAGKSNGFITNGTSSDIAQLAASGVMNSSWSVNANTQSAGGGGSHNNRQPEVAEHFIISAGAR